MSRISIGAVLALLLATTAAQAQFTTGNTGLGTGLGMNMAPGERQMTREELQREREIESAYKEAKDKIPDKKSSKDPWGNIRSAPSR